MKRLTFLAAASLVLAIGLSTAKAIDPIFYFDVNDDGPGSGIADGNLITWDGIQTNWNPNADGSGMAPGTTVAWVNGKDAVFAAGGDTAGIRYGLAITAGTTANSALIEDGATVLINSGVLDTGAGTTTVGAGTTVEIPLSTRFNSAGTLKLDGGRLLQTNSGGTGGSLISATKNLEVSANGGTVVFQSNFVNISPNFSTPAIIYGPTTAAALGTGGTTAAGVGTLIINAQDNPNAIINNPTGGYNEVRFQNAGTANSTYQKLQIDHGMFRFGNIAGQNFETAAGAVPASVLADAITLNGGFLSASWAVTLSANRGITITANGGGYDNGGGTYAPGSGGGSIVANGPLTGSGELTMKGISNTSGNRQGQLTLGNAGNVTTFTGGLNIQGATLALTESLTATHLRGDRTLTVIPTGLVPTIFGGNISISAGKTLTFGSDNSDTSYDGQTSGSGVMTKVGTGTITLNSVGEWQNSGGTNINDGVIKYTTSNAGLTGPVTIGATGKLNMNGINDTVFSLAGPAGAIVDMKDAAATAGNLTLSGASPLNTTYTGTIIGGGNLTKSSSSTQVLAGNTTLGTVALNGAGVLINNATMTASGGVTVATGSTLGGNGTISGAVTLNGNIAPGNSVGTFHITGNLSDSAATASHWAIELNGATADKVAVTGNIDLSGVDLLDITATTPTGTSWIIGSYTGTETGVFDTITAGYTVSYTGGNITLNAAPACAPGDANCDGNFNAADYVLIRKANSDITSGAGLTQYNSWRAAYSGTPGAGSGGGLNGGTVPEPASFGLLVIGLAAFGLGRRNRVA